MDRLTRTANIIKAYYSYKKNSDSATFVKEVCGFFDFIKGEPISEADMNFLLFLANEAGVPQYFDLLKDKFTDCRISDENINALTLFLHLNVSCRLWTHINTFTLILPLLMKFIK